jgi:hypothetical protein
MLEAAARLGSGSDDQGKDLPQLANHGRVRYDEKYGFDHGVERAFARLHSESSAAAS